MTARSWIQFCSSNLKVSPQGPFCRGGRGPIISYFSYKLLYSKYLFFPNKVCISNEKKFPSYQLFYISRSHSDALSVKFYCIAVLCSCPLGICRCQIDVKPFQLSLCLQVLFSTTFQRPPQNDLL